MNATSVPAPRSNRHHGLAHMLALLRASLPMHKAGIALAAIVACIPLLPMPWTLRAAAIGLLSLFACWPKLMVMTTGARQEALPSIHRNGIRAMLSLGIGGFAATWAIAFLAGGVPIVACLLYSILAATYVVLWTTDLGSVLFVVLALTMPALGRIAHESWHDFADVSPHAVFIVIVSTLLSMLVTYDIVVSRREERAFLAPCIIAGLFPLAVFACFDKATLARAMFYYEYFFIPAGVFFVLSLAGSREPASLGRLRDISFLSVLERLLYRRQRIPGERSAQLGAEDDSLWLPPRKRPASSANTPIHAPERESLLRACLGPPFAVHQRFRFAPAGLVRKFTALMTILLLGPDELLGRPAPQVLVPLFIVLVLVERLMMYLERAQDLASGSESAELALLPAWGGRAGLRSLVLPALAKPILQDAGLLLAAFWLWPSLMGRADGPALFVPAAIMMIAGTAWLLAYVCAVLADPRLADWPPQVVALAILGGSAGLWPLHAAGAAGAIASIAGAALALAACTWAASRLLRRPRPFFAG